VKLVKIRAKHGHRILLFVAFSLFACILLSAYSNTFFSPPVLDDFHTFVRNDLTHLEKMNIQELLRLKNSQFGIFRLIPMLTFGLDFWWGEGSIVAYHVTNLVIHFFAWICIWWFVYVLLSIPNVDNFELGSNKIIFSFIVASVWALHPAQTSAVTYIVQRMASLQCLFSVASLASYVSFRLSFLRSNRCCSYFWLLTCLISASLGFLSKENSFMLPVLIFLIEVYFFNDKLLKNMLVWIARNLRSFGFGMLLIVAFLLVAWILISCLENFAAGYSARHFTMWERLLTESRVVMRYVYAILVPNPSSLSIEHDVPISRSLFHPITTLYSLIAIFMMIVSAYVLRYRYKIISFGITWFLVNLLVESTIVPLELMFDHRMYMPSIGLMLVVVNVAWRSGYNMSSKLSVKRRKRFGWSVAALCCSLLSLLTFVRNEDWRDSITINRDAVLKAPQNPRAYANYSVALSRADRCEEAIEAARQAILLGYDGFEDYMVAATTIVTCHMKKNDFERAVEEGERLLDERPQRFGASALPLLHLKMGDSYRILRNFNKAYFHAIQSIELAKKISSEKYIYDLSGLLLYQIAKDGVGDKADLDGDGSPDPGHLFPEEWAALKLYENGAYEGVRFLSVMFPNNYFLQSILGKIVIVQERNFQQQKIWDWDKKYVKRIYDPSNLALFLSYMVRKNERLSFLRPLGEWLLNRAIEDAPNSPDPYILKGWYAFERDRFFEAVENARHAIELAPQYAKAWIGLGFFLEKVGDVSGALTAFQQTLELYPGYPKRHVIENLMVQLTASAVAKPEAKKQPLRGAV
jgi:tetratricopeptide (TPR) repeat protein